MHIRIIVISILLISNTLRAQVSSVSPLSSQGLGDVSFYGDAYFMGLGGNTVAIVDSTHANLFNPSSYAFVAQQLPIFSMGIAHQESFFSQNEIAARDRFSSITHMALIVPFGKRFGLGFGLKPLSRAGYELNNFEIVNNDSIFYDYSGRGEIQKFQLGFAWRLIRRLNHDLSIGANGIRYFGRIENERSAYKRSNFIESGAFEQGFLQAGAYGYDLGATYKYKPSSRHVFTLGAYYRTTQNLSMARVNTRVRFGEFGNVNSYDTLIPLTRNEGTLTLPEKLTVGFNYEFKAQRDSLSGSGRSPSFSITGEYSADPWSEYNESFGNVVVPSFFDSYSYRAGIQFIPHRDALERTTFIKPFQKWSYRFGAYSIATPYQSFGEQVSDIGATFGIGIPIALSRAVSSINLSVNYGERGGRSSEIHLRENYWGVNFGLNIAPSYDRWFKQYKLN